jgi:1-acyl-sn-glycerol-3-phosphate acyltransferase
MLVKSWAHLMLKVLNLKVTFQSECSNAKGILMSNHRSYLDIFIVLAYYPSSIVAKKELLKWPVIGQATKMARIIPVDRNHSGSLIQTMRRINEEINIGGSVILFPEGTTYKGPLTKPFKPGSFKIAHQSQIPVIPAAIYFSNEDDAWVGNDLFIPHFYRQMGKWKSKANFWIGSPLAEQTPELLMDKVKNTIDSKLQTFHEQERGNQ